MKVTKTTRNPRTHSGALTQKPSLVNTSQQALKVKNLPQIQISSDAYDQQDEQSHFFSLEPIRKTEYLRVMPVEEPKILTPKKKTGLFLSPLSSPSLQLNRSTMLQPDSAGDNTSVKSGNSQKARALISELFVEDQERYKHAVKRISDEKFGVVSAMAIKEEQDLRNRLKKSQLFVRPDRSARSSSGLGKSLNSTEGKLRHKKNQSYQFQIQQAVQDWNQDAEGEITKLTLLGMNTQKQLLEQRHHSIATATTASNTTFMEHSHSRDIRVHQNKKRLLSAASKKPTRTAKSDLTDDFPLLKQLYEAKCKDLQLPINYEQEERFFQFCHKTIKDRKFIMHEQGLGVNSAAVIGKMLNHPKFNFSILDLAKNNIGNFGLNKLARAIECNRTLISIDLGSNDIMNDGSAQLFNVLTHHPTVTALTIANHDRMHRNRIGIAACNDLCELIYSNPILSFLNIADNRIGNEGFKRIAPALTAESALVVLNLANNDLDGNALMDGMLKYLRTGRNLLELNLSSNRFGDQATTRLGKVFEENACRLHKLTLVKCNITAQGAGDLFFSLRGCTHLQMLNLSENNLSGKNFEKIVLMLWNNCKLKKLLLSQCMLGSQAIENIGEGFMKNITMHTLDVSSNMLEANCTESWNNIQCLGLFSLRVLDFSDNQSMGDVSVFHLLSALKNRMNADGGVTQPNLKELNLRNTEMEKRSADLLCHIMAQNTNLTKVDLNQNILFTNYIDKVQEFCQRNKNRDLAHQVPDIRNELGNLLLITKNGDNCSYKERLSYKQEYERVRSERQQKMIEVRNREQIIQELRIETQQMQSQIKMQEYDCAEQMRLLDDQLADLDIKIKEKLQAYEDKMYKAEVGIHIQQHKSHQILNELEKGSAELGKEKRSWRVREEDYEQRLAYSLKNLESAKLVHSLFSKQLAEVQTEIKSERISTASVQSLNLSDAEKENRKPVFKKRAGKRSTSKRVRAGGSGVYAQKPKTAVSVGRVFSVNKPI